MNITRLPTALRCIFLAALVLGAASICEANNITYDWVGNNGVSGYFSLDSSAFSDTSIFEPIYGGSQEYQFISDSYLSSLYITDGSTTFDLANVVLTSGIWFNSAVSPPAYAGGAGYTAIDALGDELSFNGPGINIVPGSGGPDVVSAGQFNGVISNPEPGTVTLLAAGLLCAAFYARRKGRAG